jgi:hypothetical protein
MSVLVSKTVPEAFQILETFSQENFGMTLQELKDALVNTELAGVIMNMFVAGDTESDFIQQVKDFQIDSLKNDENLKNLTLKALINMMIESSQPQPEETPNGGMTGEDGTITEEGAMKTSDEVVEEPVDYVAEYIAMLTQMKGVTLAQMEMYMPEIPVNEITELTMTNSLTFNADGTKVTGAGVAFSADMNLTIDNYNPEIEDYVPTAGDVKITASLNIDEFVTAATPITAPAEDEYRDVENGGNSGGSVEMGYNEVQNEFGFVRFNSEHLEGEYKFGEDYIIHFWSDRQPHEEEYGYGMVIYFSDMQTKPINITEEQFYAYMNQYAYYIRNKYPNCRALAINWGAWNGGMVNLDALYVDALRERGYILIPLEVGANYFANEFLMGLPSAQILINNTGTPAFRAEERVLG